MEASDDAIPDLVRRRSDGFPRGGPARGRRGLARGRPGGPGSGRVGLRRRAAQPAGEHRRHRRNGHRRSVPGDQGGPRRIASSTCPRARRRWRGPPRSPPRVAVPKRSARSGTTRTSDRASRSATALPGPWPRRRVPSDTSTTRPSQGLIPSRTLARMSSAAPSPISARPPVWPRSALPAFTLVSVLNTVFEEEASAARFRPDQAAADAAARPRDARDRAGDAATAARGAARRVRRRHHAAVQRQPVPRRDGRIRRRARLLHQPVYTWRGAAPARPAGVRGRMLRRAVGSADHPAVARPDSNMRIPVACYSLLLAGMATASFTAGARTGLRAARCSWCRPLIAGAMRELARADGHRLRRQCSPPSIAQYLLATGCMTFAERARLRPRTLSSRTRPRPGAFPR